MKVHKLVRTALLVLLITMVGAGQALAQFPNPLDIGTLPAGKSLTITFEVTVNSPFPSGPTQVCNQGTVTADGGVNVLTDDPDVGGADDPTCTQVTRPDIGVIAINAPSSDCGLGAETVTITIQNFSAVPLTGFDVEFEVTGPIATGPVTETFTGTLPASGTAMHTFSGTADLSDPGVYTITARTLYVDDPNSLNDEASANVENEGPCIKPFVFVSNKITLKRTKQDTPAGDMHANGAFTIEKGDPSTYNSNLTATGKITIQKDNTINGNVKSPLPVSNSGTVNGTITVGAVATEPLPSLSYSAGGLNKTVPGGGSLTLAPGSYGIVTLNGGGTLKLTSGEYFMNELRYPGSEAVIEIDLSSGDPVTINVVSNLQLGKEVEIGLLPNGEDDSDLVTFNTLQSSAITWGREAYLLGTFNAPNAKVTLAKNSQLRGAMCVKELIVERDCLFLHHESPGSLPGPGNLPKSIAEPGEVEEVTSNQQPVTNYELAQNYPNPFNPSTMITFALPQAGEVSLAIYNMSGQLVRTLAQGEYASGRYQVLWNATDDRGARMASGVYLYILKAGEFTVQRKLVLMK
jgi:hypothetical protein